MSADLLQKVKAAQGFSAKFKIIIAGIAQIPEPDTKAKNITPCPRCKEPLKIFVGRHSGKKMIRHEPGGCQPWGKWIL